MLSLFLKAFGLIFLAEMGDKTLENAYNLGTIRGYKERVDNSGILGFLSLMGLQIAQIFLVVLPGEPLEILAGMCYGAVGGTIFLLFSFMFLP